MTHLAPLASLAAEVIASCRENNLKIATAESCTGGLIIGVLTEIAGSSAAVERGFVTYSDESKTEMLGVPAGLIKELGAVSRDVAIAMVQGAIERSDADIAVSVTGVAGPGGGSEHKPVGLVHFAAMRRGKAAEAAEQRFGDIGRSEIRLATIREALGMLRGLI